MFFLGGLHQQFAQQLAGAGAILFRGQQRTQRLRGLVGVLGQIVGEGRVVAVGLGLFQIGAAGGGEESLGGFGVLAFVEPGLGGAGAGAARFDDDGGAVGRCDGNLIGRIGPISRI